MKKIYIAGKITGTDLEQTFKKFEEKENELKAQGWEVVNPMKLKHDHDKKWESYMTECLSALKQCQAIYLLPDWDRSAGAVVEHLFAIKMKLEIHS